MSLRPTVPALFIALTLSGAVGCRFDKEPLRAGWLTGGVYQHPPQTQCRAPRPPGRPYSELNRWSPPSLRVDAEVRISVPWAGSFSSELHTADSPKGSRAKVSSKARRPMRIVEDNGVGEQIPGFIAGVDLRRYRRIAFIADTSGGMCGAPTCPNGGSTRNLPSTRMAAIGDQIDAAVSGLGLDQWFVVYAGSADREMRLLPNSPQGRALAGQFVRGQVCSGNQGVRGHLLRALEDSPDVIVLLTAGGHQRRRTDTERHSSRCQYMPSILYCYVDEVTEAVDMQRIADGKRLPPMITVSMDVRDSTWLQNLAEATGGAYVELAE